VWLKYVSQNYGLHKETIDSQYNLSATVNHKVGRWNLCHYIGISKCIKSSHWYSYSNANVVHKKIVNRNNNFVLTVFQKTASILFYVNETAVSVCSNNLCTNNEVIDRMGGAIEDSHQSHKHPPSIVNLEEDSSSSLVNSVELLPEPNIIVNRLPDSVSQHFTLSELLLLQNIRNRHGQLVDANHQSGDLEYLE
jgi:hypothetical protein